MNLRIAIAGTAFVLLSSQAVASHAALPVVNAFTTVASSNSPVQVTAFTATDNDGAVVGYMCTDTSSKPSASNPNWTPIPPQSCATSKSGTVTLYGWAKDNANGVSSGKAFTTWVPGVHSHSIPDVAGLQTALDAKAPANHDHDGLYQTKYGKVAVVATSGGDYASPVDAMNDVAAWCGIPSADNPCLVKVMPGVFDIADATLALLEFVDVEGSGENTTKITGTLTTESAPAAVVVGANNSELRHLTIENRGTGPQSIALYMDGASPRLFNVTVLASGTPGVPAPVWNLGISMNNASPVLDRVTVVGQGWVVTAISCVDSSPKLSDVRIDVSGAADTWGILFAGTSSPEVRDATIRSSAGKYGHAIVASNGAVIALRDVKATGTGVALFVNRGSSTPGTEVLVDSSELKGDYGWIQSTHYPGYAVKVGASKISGAMLEVYGLQTCVGTYNEQYVPLGTDCR